MTLQQPNFCGINPAKNNRPILCHKCGAEIVFSKDKVGPSGRKIPLDPFFNNTPHAQHCMYFTAPSEPDTDSLFFDFLKLVPNQRQRRIIGAVGRAND
ncbi:MAG: hypothetical protein ACRD8W_07740 [Nitrososphaeraceae archaeon]